MEEYKIAIVNCWSDSDKGGSAIIFGMIKSIRKVIPKARFSLISMYSQSDPKYERAYRHLKRAFPDIHIYSSPIPNSRFIFRLKFPYKKRIWRLMSSLCLLILCSRKFIFKNEAVKALQEADVVLSAGGHYLRTSRSIKSLFELYFTAYPLLIAWRLGKPFGMYGHSFGPFHNKLSRHFIRWLLSKANFIGVRENFSKKELIRCGVSTERIQLIPDAAFVLEPEFSERVCDILNRNNLEPRKFVAVTVRHWYEIEITINGYRRYLQELAKSIDFIVDKLGFKVAIVLQNIRDIDAQLSDDLNDDLTAGKQIFDLLRCRNKSNVVLISDDLSSSELIALYRQSLILVGARLHSILFALIAGTPSIAIAVSKHKTLGIMQILGLERYVLDSDFKSSDLIMLIKELITERERIAKYIRTKVLIQRGRALQVPQRLLSTIQDYTRDDLLS